jgi:hypothetical protein
MGTSMPITETTRASSMEETERRDRAKRQIEFSQQLICYADELENGMEHSLIVDNIPVGSDARIGVNYAEVWGESLWVLTE